MTRVLSTSIAALAVGIFATSAAHSADIGLKDTIKSGTDVPYGAAPIHWTGLYVGAHGGWGNANHDLKATGVTDAYDVAPEEIAATEGSCTLSNSEQSLTFVDSTGKKCEPGKNYLLDTTGRLKPVTDAEYTPPAEAFTIPGYTVAETVTEAFIDGINGRGVFGGVNVGADIQRGKIVFGVFGEYSWSGVESEVGIVGLGSEKITEDNSWVVAARLGYLFGSDDRALLYGLVGYGQTDVNYSGLDKDVTFSGLVAGAGGEYALTQNISIGIEWQHFFGGEETIFDGPGGGFDRLVVTDEMSTDKVMAKAKFKLNAGLPGLMD